MYKSGDLTEEEYKKQGATLLGSAREVLEKSDVILKLNYPSDKDTNSIKGKSILIGSQNHEALCLAITERL